MITISQEDNMQLMSRYPDGYFDLAIVDPPYGILNKTPRGGDHKFNKSEYGQWDIKPSNEYFKELFRVSKIHPTQKPVELYEWLLNMYAKPTDKILDTHLGSGTIAIACYHAGIDLTACEISKEYFLKALGKIKEVIPEEAIEFQENNFSITE